MKTFIFTLLSFFMFAGSVFAQTTTTSLPQVYANPGEEVVVPVSVTSFNSVASVSLALTYDPSVLQFVGLQNINASLSGNFITNVMPGGLGEELILSWFALTPANIGNGTLMEVKFSYYGGSSSLKWDTLTYGNCQYTNLMGDPIITLFTDGVVNQVNPNTTWVQSVTAIPSSDILVPVTVASFQNVSEIHLSLSHDHSVISYQSTDYVNPAFPVSTVSVTNGGNIVHINWSSSNPVSLGDDTLCILRFHYNGGTSLLEWDTVTSGACYYKDVNGNVLPGTFVSAAVHPALVQLGIASASMCNGSAVTLPVSVGDANGIKSFSIKLQYNDAVVQFADCQNIHPLLSGGTFSATANNGLISISWSSPTAVDLGTCAVFEVNFQTIVQNGGLSDLVWAASECSFQNAAGLSFPLNLVAGSLMITPFINVGNDQEICNYHTTTLFAGALFASYVWSTGDTTAELVVDSTMGSGVYSVTVTDVMGCTGVDEVLLNFVPCIGVEEFNAQSANLSVYPNPVSSNLVYCELNGFTGEVELAVIDLTGRIVATKSVQVKSTDALTETLNITGLQGIYVVRVQDRNKVMTQRMVCE